jgi:hypothetical protein
MNLLKSPEHAERGDTYTQAEFEDLAVEAGLMDSLMDRDDLSPGEFLSEAVARANTCRLPENLLQWVILPGLTPADSCRVALVHKATEFSIRRMNEMIQTMQTMDQDLRKAAWALVEM